MVRSLIPFTQLTRTGVMPQFRVCRLPLVTQGVELSVGEVVAPDTFRDRTRFRQLYEQRRIEPVVAPKDSRQAARERMERANVQRGLSSPVAAQSATQSAPMFDSPSIPVEEDGVEEEQAYRERFDKPRPSGYTPRRTVRKP